jgi:peptide/nickel transport system permease protein
MRSIAIVRRVAFAPVVVGIVAAITYLSIRLLRPDMYPGESAVAGAGRDVERAFLHFDFGRACNWHGCPHISEMWARGVAWDLALLAGALVIGVAGGVLAGLWCASRRRSLSARALEAVAMVLYCAPVYIVGALLLQYFNPIYGHFPVPAFFDAEPKWVSPFSEPWDWFRQLLVPWLVLAAPLGAMCLRLTLASTAEALDEDYVRTAVAKGVSRRRVVRRHAGPASLVTTFSFVGISVPLVVTNLVIVERTFSVPGFFRHTWKALGHVDPPEVPDFPMLCALTVWGAVLIVVLGLLTDAVMPWLDPRIRANT